jgi:hypothetical protein
MRSEYTAYMALANTPRLPKVYVKSSPVARRRFSLSLFFSF